MTDNTEETLQLDELLTDSFVQLHTDFASVEGFLFGLPKPERCTRDLLDRYVMRHSHFKTWAELVSAAKV
jgi:hypothetical protein